MVYSTEDSGSVTLNEKNDKNVNNTNFIDNITIEIDQRMDKLYNGDRNQTEQTETTGRSNSVLFYDYSTVRSRSRASRVILKKPTSRNQSRNVSRREQSSAFSILDPAKAERISNGLNPIDITNYNLQIDQKLLKP